MKNRLIKILFCLVAVVSSANASEHAQKVLHDNKEFYLAHQDKIINAFLENGTFPNSDDMMRISTFEHQFLSMARLGGFPLDQMPTLVIANMNIKDFRFVPGQLIDLRAREAGLDLRKDRIRGRSFNIRKK